MGNLAALMILQNDCHTVRIAHLSKNMVKQKVKRRVLNVLSMIGPVIGLKNG